MKLPITKEQRRRIEYRARVEEQNRMIREVRAALFARGYSDRYVKELVTDILNARATPTKGSDK